MGQTAPHNWKFTNWDKMLRCERTVYLMDRPSGGATEDPSELYQSLAKLSHRTAHFGIMTEQSQFLATENLQLRKFDTTLGQVRQFCESFELLALSASITDDIKLHCFPLAMEEEPKSGYFYYQL